MAPTIGIIGATGQTGSSIVNGLLSVPSDITASNIISLTRPSSISNPANASFSSRGVSIRPFTLTAPHADLVSSLRGIDVLICCISGMGDEMHQQIPIADAAKEAGVQRFIPSAWLPVIPLGGVHLFRDLKERTYAHLKSISLPYTIIDVGWWYQISYPKLPSGKVDYAISLPADEIFGTGEQPSALTDLRDIGRYVARIVLDERTINKYVFCYNEMYSQLDTYAIMERLSGETLARNFVSREEMETDIAEALPLFQQVQGDKWAPEAMILGFDVVARQYALSWGVRGDNTPEVAKKLGYVTSKELWPEMNFVGYEDFLRDVVEGGGEPVYENKRAGMMQVMNMLKEKKAAKKSV